MMGVKALLDVGQVAEMLGLSIAMIRKWVWMGIIPCIKINRAVRFSASEIQDWTMGKSTSPETVYEGGGE